jgi:hydrogenase nickel incorporation protein HypB
MFKVANAVVFSKMDTLPVFDFDLQKAVDHITKLNPRCVYFPLSAKKGDGMQALADYVLKEVKAYQGR